jgi:hypothetical protein
VVAWAAVAEEQPELVAATERAFAARRLKVLATVRADGAPRLSEISGAFLRDGELWLALIPSAKERDLAADPRCSVLCGSPTDASSINVRVSGRAERVRDPEAAAVRLGIVAAGTKLRFGLFRVDIGEVVVTEPVPQTRQIRIEWWNDASGAGRQVRPGG